MEKGVVALVLIFALFSTGVVVLVLTESKNSDSDYRGKVPYSNIGPGLFYSLTPQSILDENDIKFWSKNRIVEKRFTIDTKFGQDKEQDNLFNYTISSSGDCEREFDKKNYTVSVYYQSAGIGPDRYNVYTVRKCLIESVTPTKLECTGEAENQKCLYSSKVDCVCYYATEV